MPVNVRLADLSDEGDAEAIVDLTNAYARDPMGGGQPLPERVQEDLVEAMREHGGVEVLLAEIWEDAEDGEPVGIAEAGGETRPPRDDGRQPVGICTVIYKFSTFAAAPTLNVHDIAVLEDHRGRGIGRRLLEAAEERARKQGCARMSLEVLPENPAHRLYERSGFEAKSEFMVKPLTEAGDSYASDRS